MRRPISITPNNNKNKSGATTANSTTVAPRSGAVDRLDHPDPFISHLGLRPSRVVTRFFVEWFGRPTAELLEAGSATARWDETAEASGCKVHHPAARQIS